jgi:hypothetical protein
VPPPCPAPRRSAFYQPASSSISRPHPTATLAIEICASELTLDTILISMAGLDRTIAVLDVLGTVVQAVPVVGENLKSAIEMATKTCEMVKVRMLFLAWCSRSTIYLEDERQPRSV